MNISVCEQGSPEWLALRTGKVTASRVGDATTFLKNGSESAARASCKAELVAEILSGSCADHFVSSWMERGTLLEPIARTAYELTYLPSDVLVEQVGFIVHPHIARSGCSPDGLIRPTRGLELKCPKIETHLKWMLAGVLPTEHEPQVMWNLACCPEIPVWDFVSFCPDLPERHQLFRVEVPRNNTRIAELEDGVLKILAEVDALIEQLNVLNPEIEKKTVREADPFPGTYLTDEELSLI